MGGLLRCKMPDRRTFYDEHGSHLRHQWQGRRKLGVRASAPGSTDIRLAHDAGLPRLCQEHFGSDHSMSFRFGGWLVWWRLQQQAIHAARFVFRHPLRFSARRWEQRLPPDWFPEEVSARIYQDRLGAARARLTGIATLALAGKTKKK